MLINIFIVSIKFISCSAYLKTGKTSINGVSGHVFFKTLSNRVEASLNFGRCPVMLEQEINASSLDNILGRKAFLFGSH